MPTFKVKDLMINLGAVDEVAHLRCFTNTIGLCQPCTIVHAATLVCPPHTCPGGSIVCPAVTIPFQSIACGIDFSPEDIGILRQHLEKQIALLDQHEKVQAEQLKPQTLAEVEMLENKLSES